MVAAPEASPWLPSKYHSPSPVRKRGGRKLVLALDGAPGPPLAPQVDGTLVKAIARAFRWQKMLETDRYATIKEIAKAEKINPLMSAG